MIWQRHRSQLGSRAVMRLPAAAGLVGAATIQGRPVAFTACCTLPAQQMQGSCCSPGLQHAFLAVSYAPFWSLSYRCLLARSPGDRALQEARHLASSARRQLLRQALALQGPALSELYHCPLPIPSLLRDKHVAVQLMHSLFQSQPVCSGEWPVSTQCFRWTSCCKG